MVNFMCFTAIESRQKEGLKLARRPRVFLCCSGEAVLAGAAPPGEEPGMQGLVGLGGRRVQTRSGVAAVLGRAEPGAWGLCPPGMARGRWPLRLVPRACREAPAASRPFLGRVRL